jgi:hypothetical protein
MLREGRARSNTTVDHITVLDQAVTQIPDSHRHGTPILIRSDSAGCTFGLLAHIRGLRAPGVDARFSVGVAITEPIRQAILTAKAHGTWAPALDGVSQCHLPTLRHPLATADGTWPLVSPGPSGRFMASGRRGIGSADGVAACSGECQGPR